MKKMFGLVLLLVASSAFAGPTCTKEDKAKWQDQKKFEEKYPAITWCSIYIEKNTMKIDISEGINYR